MQKSKTRRKVIIFGKETIDKVHKFDVDCTDVEWKTLKEYGLKKIQEDDLALINYAVVDLLKKYIESKDGTVKSTKKIKKAKK